MRTPAVVRVFVGAVCLAVIGLVGVIPPGASSRAQTTKPGAAQATPPAADATDAKAVPAEESSRDPALDEQLDRAREDVEILEFQLGSKKAAIKEAETRVAYERALAEDYVKATKAGIGSSIGQKRGNLSVLQAESERSRRQAELGLLEKRYEQAKRRLTMIARRGASGTGILETMGRDLSELEARIIKVEAKVELLVEKMEDAKDDIVRLNQQVKLLMQQR